MLRLWSCPTKVLDKSLLRKERGDGFPLSSLKISLLMIDFWLCCLLAAEGATLQLRCSGFSVWWLCLLRSTGSRSRRLQ